MSSSETSMNESIESSVDEFFELFSNPSLNRNKSRCKIDRESSESTLLPTLSPTLSNNTICPLINENAFECPICIDLLCEPVTLQCGHTYCEHCISQWIIKSPRKEKCRCPSCKAIIYNKFNKQNTSYTLRDFLKNQFTVKYKERYNDTLQCRRKWNKRLIELKITRDEEIKQLKRCCGIFKLKRWLIHNFELMINPHLHQNARSWLLRWLLLYCFILCLIIPFLVPIISNLFSQHNTNINTRNNVGDGGDINRSSQGINLYFLDDIFEYVGLNTISTVSTMTFGPIISGLHGVLQYFGAIVPIKNTAYLPDHYIINSIIQYDEIGNIYTTDSTDLYYKNLFINWKSSELKSFVKRHNIDNTCLERSCYTDTIMEYLKISEWQKLENHPLPISILQQYLNHYNIEYNQCYDTFWSKNYQCFAEKAASIKILNDVYYHKKYLLSFKASQRHRKKQNNHNNVKHQQQKDKKNYNNYNNHHQHHKQHQHEHEHERNTAFGFDDIGNFAFNILSGLR